MSKRDRRTQAQRDERVMPPELQLPVVVEVETVTVTTDCEITAVVDGHTLPMPRRYSPPNCSMCAADRPKPTDNYVEVTTTRRETGYIFRYCKCKFCGNTFKHTEKQ